MLFEKIGLCKSGCLMLFWNLHSDEIVKMPTHALKYAEIIWDNIPEY